MDKTITVFNKETCCFVTTMIVDEEIDPTNVILSQDSYTEEHVPSDVLNTYNKNKHIIFYDDSKTFNKWELYPREIYRVNRMNNQFISKLTLPISDSNNFKLIKNNDNLIFTPIPFSYTSDDKIFWIDGKWNKINPPDDLFMPHWNGYDNKWEESHKEIIYDKIDSETSQLIKQWCVNQGKNEEYYLNKGIGDSNNADYLLYKTKKSEIIAQQKIRKETYGYQSS